jgi:hypothetical protein
MLFMENKKNLEEVLKETKIENEKTPKCGYCEKPIKGESYKGRDSKLPYCDIFCYQWDNTDD